MYLKRIIYFQSLLYPGAQLGNFERGGCRYIYNMKVVKCVATLFRNMSLAKV